MVRIRPPYRISAHAARTARMAKALMFMGTGSDVGKSTIVAGLCRAFADRGLRVAPFKPQNMSNNAAVTADGGEIGRAQALQARAARRNPLTAMNPVLLKPEHESGSQLIVRGKRVGSYTAREYWAMRETLMPQVLAAFHELAADADLILIEGAGSASEVNLRATDIANFGFARAANVPVVLIGDIDRGGVIASLVGTFTVCNPADAALIRATLINRFRGDPSLFADGQAIIADRTGVPCLGPVPFFPDAAKLPAEDSLVFDRKISPGNGSLVVAVPRLPRIANFDDLDPLRAEPDVSLVIVEPGQPLPQDADLIIVPGSKATRADLVALRETGWDVDILAHHRAGKRVIGICGGYQMLGRAIHDPLGIEGEPGSSDGLGLLDVTTTLGQVKHLRVEDGTHLASRTPLTGYHMHMGVTHGPDTDRPFAQMGSHRDGATSSSGLVAGTYMHGIFTNDTFRYAFLHIESAIGFDALVEAAIDDLASHLSLHIDLDQLLSLADAL
jgi:adenosylcobyric acid synthase